MTSLAETPRSPLTVWAVSDGRAGIEAQVLGLSEAVARLRPARIVVKRIGWKGGLGRLPSWLNLAPRRALTRESGVEPPWPDLWIAAGRATLPLSIRMRGWSRGRTFVVQTQDPRMSTARFDLVIPPRHDGLHGDNVFPIVGSPNRVTPDRLRTDLARFRSRIEALPRPRVAVLIGGRSKAFDLPPERALVMAREIEAAVVREGGSLMLTFSRRTPERARALMAAELRHLPGFIWEGEGDNPYFAFLAGADYILATEDSTNIAAEAASTGAPVFILKMQGEGAKFRLFHQDLESLGATRPFTGTFDRWSYPPLAETDRAAAEILRRLDIHEASAFALRGDSSFHRHPEEDADDDASSPRPA
jgi:mitochondrial fission protein ELM1